MTKGIDISGYQGKIDFDKVKSSGVEFVIIKAGYGTSSVESFERNYASAKAAGLHIGAYWYSYAESADGARQEADACIKTLSGKQFDYPVYFDLEEQTQFSKGEEFCSGLVVAFCSRLEEAGYFAGLYMSRYFLENFISERVRARYTVWVAEYSSECRYVGEFGIWQYGVGRVKGVENECDLDLAYIDYPPIIKGGGFNGYKKTPSVDPPKPVPPKEGSSVIIKSGAKTYDGKTLAKFVYDRIYTVSELVGDRAVVVYRGVTVAAVNLKDLIEVKEQG